MTKPTEAPWRVILDDTGGEYTGWPSIVGSEEVDAAIVHRAGFKQEFWGDLSQRECIANAHLMASSPELRFALLEAMRQLNIFSNRFGQDIPTETLNLYHAALAKSNGNPPPEPIIYQGDDEHQPSNVGNASHAAFMRCMTPSPELAAVVGQEPLPRTEVTKKIWDYIKRNGLQDSTNRRMINADPALQAVFAGKKVVSMFEMTKLISDHLKE